MLAERKKPQIMDNDSIDIHALPVTQEYLSFCTDGLDGFEAWAKALPMGNLGAASKQLFLATKELSTTAFSTTHRYKRLEIIRDKTHAICELLSKRFLNHSVLLNENDRKVANLAQALMIQLAAGYKRVAIDEWQWCKQKKKPPQKLMTFAIHRAIADTSQAILRAYQLYQTPPRNAWYDLHQLYLLAENSNIAGYSIKDEQTRFLSTSSIRDLYTRALLLGCAKTNQLRQQELGQVYDATELWCTRVRLTPSQDPQALFTVNLFRDYGPVYQKLAANTPDSTLRAIDTRALVIALQRALAKQEGAATIPGNLSENIVNQLIHAWGILKERSFRRSEGTGQLHISTGLLGSHYFVCGQKSFPFLLQEWMPGGLPKDKKKIHPDDAWAQSFDAGGQNLPDPDSIDFDANAFINKNNLEENIDTGPKGQVMAAQIVNTAPGGYCIRMSNPPNSLQTGEIMVIREAESHAWSLATICWIRNIKGQAVEAGLELLAPKSSAIAIRVLNKTGENGEFLRGLVLPAMPAVGQEQTLIVPTIPFKVGGKAEILEGDQIHRVQLLARVKSTRSFVQYRYRNLSSAPNPDKTNNASNKQVLSEPAGSFWDQL